MMIKIPSEGRGYIPEDQINLCLAERRKISWAASILQLSNLQFMNIMNSGQLIQVCN